MISACAPSCVPGSGSRRSRPSPSRATLRSFAARGARAARRAQRSRAFQKANIAARAWSQAAGVSEIAQRLERGPDLLDRREARGELATPLARTAHEKGQRGQRATRQARVRDARAQLCEEVEIDQHPARALEVVEFELALDARRDAPADVREAALLAERFQRDRGHVGADDGWAELVLGGGQALFEDGARALVSTQREVGRRQHARPALLTRVAREDGLQLVLVHELPALREGHDLVFAELLRDARPELRDQLARLGALALHEQVQHEPLLELVSLRAAQAGQDRCAQPAPARGIGRQQALQLVAHEPGLGQRLRAALPQRVAQAVEVDTDLLEEGLQAALVVGRVRAVDSQLELARAACAQLLLALAEAQADGSLEHRQARARAARGGRVLQPGAGARDFVEALSLRAVGRFGTALAPHAGREAGAGLAAQEAAGGSDAGRLARRRDALRERGVGLRPLGPVGLAQEQRDARGAWTRVGQLEHAAGQRAQSTAREGELDGRRAGYEVAARAPQLAARLGARIERHERPVAARQ